MVGGLAGRLQRAGPAANRRGRRGRIRRPSVSPSPPTAGAPVPSSDASDRGLGLRVTRSGRNGRGLEGIHGPGQDRELRPAGGMDRPVRPAGEGNPARRLKIEVKEAGRRGRWPPCGPACRRRSSGCPEPPEALYGGQQPSGGPVRTVGGRAPLTPAWCTGSSRDIGTSALTASPTWWAEPRGKACGLHNVVRGPAGKGDYSFGDLPELKAFAPDEGWLPPRLSTPSTRLPRCQRGHGIRQCRTDANVSEGQKLRPLPAAHPGSGGRPVAAATHTPEIHGTLCRRTPGFQDRGRNQGRAGGLRGAQRRIQRLRGNALRDRRRARTSP